MPHAFCILCFAGAMPQWGNHDANLPTEHQAFQVCEELLIPVFPNRKNPNRHEYFLNYQPNTLDLFRTNNST